MEIRLTVEDVKRAVLIDIFSKTGARIQPEECEIFFTKDGNSTRVEMVSIVKN